MLRLRNITSAFRFHGGTVALPVLVLIAIRCHLDGRSARQEAFAYSVAVHQTRVVRVSAVAVVLHVLPVLIGAAARDGQFLLQRSCVSPAQYGSVDDGAGDPVSAVHALAGLSSTSSSKACWQ